MAKVYFDSTDTTFTVSNNGVSVYGAEGTQSVVDSGATGLVIDQNVESLLLTGALTDYTFQQAGNQIQVRDAAGTTVLATIAVQGDDNGTQLTFSNGTANARLIAGVMTLGGATISALAPVVAPTATIDPTVTSTGSIGGQTYTLTAGIDTIVAGAGNDTFVGTLDNSGATAATLSTLDSLDGGAGVNTLNVSDLDDLGSPLPPGLVLRNIQTINLAAAADAVIDTTAVDVTGLTNLNVTRSFGNDTVTVGDGTAVNVTDTFAGGSVNVTATDSAVTVNAKGFVTVSGGSTQAVTAADGANLSGATGAISLVDTANNGSNIFVDNGTSVAITANATATDMGNIIVGGPTAAPTGTVTVIENLTGSKAFDIGANTNTIQIQGGSTVSVTSNVTQPVNTATIAGATNYTTHQAGVVVLGTDVTTAVTVTEAAAVTAAASRLATAAVAEVDNAVFTALAGNASVTVGGLTFTAGAAGTTIAQTAAAFANLSSGAVQGNSTLGSYTGALKAGFASAAVSGATSNTVVFTATTAGAVAPLVGTTQATVGSDAISAITGKGGVATNSVKINDVNYGSTTLAGTITSATLSNFTTATILDNALTTLSATNGSNDIIIDNSGLTAPTNKTLALTLNGQTGGVLGDHNIYTTLNVTTAGAKSTLADISDTALTALTVAGTQALTLTSTAGMSALKTVAVSGSAGLTATFGQTTLTDVNAAATSGANTVTIFGDKATYEGGTGVDTVTLLATASKAISLGAGDDSLTLAVGTILPTALLDGGTGTDTLSMVAADAVTASGNALFASKVVNFEHLTLTGGGTNAVDVAQLGNYNYVTSHDNTLLTLNNLTSGGTVVIDGANTADVVSITNATTNTADVLNLVVSNSAAINAGSVTAAKVETINVTATDTAATHVNTIAHDLALVTTSATAVNVTGNAHLNLDVTGNTALTTIDASGMTGGITVTTTGIVAETVKGGASSNTLTAHTGIVADHLIGGAGADTIIANAGLDILTGNGGNDHFVITTASTNVNTYATITDANAGDTLTFALGGTVAFTQAQVTLAATAVFQDFANAAVHTTAPALGNIAWFQFGGDTYVVQNETGAEASFNNGHDLIVKLAGIVDLSHTSISADHGTLLIA